MFVLLGSLFDQAWLYSTGSIGHAAVGYIFEHGLHQNLGTRTWGHPQTGIHLAQFNTISFRSFLPRLTLWLSPNVPSRLFYLALLESVWLYVAVSSRCFLSKNEMILIGWPVIRPPFFWRALSCCFYLSLTTKDSFESQAKIRRSGLYL